MRDIGHMLPKCKTPYPSSLTWYNSGSQDITIRFGLGKQVADVMRPFSLFVALCDENPPTLRSDGQTDGRTDVVLVA